MKKTFLLLITLTLLNNLSAKDKATSDIKILNTDNITKNAGVPIDNKKVLTNITYGSCAKQYFKDKLIFSNIAKTNPDIFIWMGDNYYLDTFDDMNKKADAINMMLKDKNYQNLLKACPVIGTWDDHDYGVNDIGKEYPKRVESQDLFLDFVGEPKNSPRRKQKGIYYSYTIGPVGKQVKIYLLDTRYHRDKIGSNGTILGKKQWGWFKKELMNSRAQLDIIVSSIQVIPDEHRFEKWDNFEKERKKLFKLIQDSKKSGIIILSGDRHIGEISKMDLPKLKYPLYEVTSSSLTHSSGGYLKHEKNKYRITKQINKDNFGTIKIDWGNKNSKTIKVNLELRDQKNELLASKKVEFAK